MNSHKFHSVALFLLLLPCLALSQSRILSAETENPISYATISFDNGYGMFADDDGFFIFSQKTYPGIDSLHISALGFKNVSIPASEVPSVIYMKEETSELEEVIVRAKLDRPFNKVTIEPYLDDDYYKCWLPTIESEIAVFFENAGSKLKKITHVHFPLALESKDWDKRNRKNADKKPFSTLFKVKFYKNENGLPSTPLTRETIVFRATEEMGNERIIDVSDYDLFVPANGVFVSLQVLGYTDDKGKLLPNKKYKEIKSRSGIVRIPTNFRPLLPFTDEIEEDRTFIKRVFIHENSWVRFNKDNVYDSSLLKAGLNNYGIGLSYNVYKDE